MIENREIKSTVFADLFCDDEKDGIRNFLSLYNAIHGTSLKLEETIIKPKRINQAIYKTFYNDISMIINGKLIVLIEHQSTLNSNMPLRFLEYYVHLLYGIVPHEARYKEDLYKIPTPEFYVFYNGQRTAPQNNVMKLSEAFIEKQDYPMCELIVNFLNIASPCDEKLPILKNCDILKQYCEFMDIVFSHRARMKDNPTSEETQNCYELAIHESISRGILSDYLTRKASEVINMFIGEYDYDTDMRVKSQEAEERGHREGEISSKIASAKNLLKMNLLTLEQIAQAVDLPLEEILKIQKTIKIPS
ncbi:MAG: hypothetical protein K5681_06210 [Treponema sp.]|nr:hypothetical protein [Treponema sp.]